MLEGLGDKRGAACERDWVIKGEQHVRGLGDKRGAAC